MKFTELKLPRVVRHCESVKGENDLCVNQACDGVLDSVAYVPQSMLITSGIRAKVVAHIKLMWL